MANNTKTIRKGFEYRNCDDFAAYLNHMARQGWHFKELRAGLVFEKGEPEEAVYAVEVFSGASEYDTRPEPNTKEFAEYCEAAGWQFIDASRKFTVFKRIREDAVPIMTDEERLDSIAKVEQKDILYHLIISALWSGMQLMEYTTVSFARNIFSNSNLLITGLWLVFLLASVCRTVHFYIWKLRMADRIRQGKTVRFGSSQGGLRVYPVYNWISLAGCAVYLLGCWYFGQSRMVLYFFGYLAVLLVMGFLISKFRPEANTNAIIQTVVPLILFIGLMVVSLYQVYDSDGRRRDAQQIPLYAQDIGLDFGELESATGYVTNSIFGTHTAYSLHYEEMHSMFYVAYQTEEDWILDHLWEIETDGAANANRTDCAENWGADIGFQNRNGKYFLRFPEGILIFTLYDDTSLTHEQIAVILEILDLR